MAEHSQMSHRRPSRGKPPARTPGSSPGNPVGTNGNTAEPASSARPGDDARAASERSVEPKPLVPMSEAAEVREPDLPEPLLFESAWEVCNQIGGIYQVLRSKAAEMTRRWGDRYTLIGPYEPEKAALEFSAGEPDPAIAGAIETLRNEGVRVHAGRWLVEGSPRVILLEHWRGTDHLDAVKYRLWEHHRIPSPNGNPMADGVISFAEAVRRLMQLVSEAVPDRSVLFHGHEWMGGLAIPMLRHDNSRVGLTFTTHATLLGRYLASGDDRFYDHLPFLDEAAEAERYNVVWQHRMERSCAHAAQVFTTVSPITAEECTHLLGRTPEVITPNGLNMARFDVGHDFQTLHAKYKAKIHRFTMGHFFPSYSFDLEQTIYMFTSGRYEPNNKGFDLCLESMARLNADLKAAKSETTVVFFIISKRPTRSLNPLVLERRGVLFELRGVCDAISEQIAERLFPAAAAGQTLGFEGMVDEYWAMRYRRTQQAFGSGELPYITTHVFDDDATDPVLNQIRSLGLVNGPEDRVKVVYHPDFISPASPLWGIDYEQFVRGCHVGVFPSAYEPWGYTPLESIAMGVPALTSDLAGFGKYVQTNMADHDAWGMHVITRRGRSYHDAAAELASRLLEFCRLDQRGRIKVRNAVEQHSEAFDWSELVGSYVEAHDMTLARMTAGAG
ncbi:MAG: glycosyltransferase [Planctomycetota bacterium]